MVTLRILKRKDAASVVVAVVLGFVVYGFLSGIAEPWASDLSSRTTAVASDWHDQYLYPVLLAVLEVLVLEVLSWLYVWSVASAKQK
jgi:hypothetical protein